MCGRYATTRSDTDLGRFFDAVSQVEDWRPSWNVAPTDPVPVIRRSQRLGARVVDTARWGFVPPWATDLRGAARMINARAETVATTPAYAPAFARRRCLVPADGWYEWRRDGGRKRVYYLTARDGHPLALAGLWGVWGPAAIRTCSVLTTAAQGDLAGIHDRMPLILPRQRWADWLDADDVTGLLAPVPPTAVEIREVGPEVGNVRSNGPELINALGPDGESPTLF